MARTKHTMRTPERKKTTRRIWKTLAKQGLINDSDGKWIRRDTGKNQMHGDFHPQN